MYVLKFDSLYWSAVDAAFVVGQSHATRFAAKIDAAAFDAMFGAVDGAIRFVKLRPRA